MRIDKSVLALWLCVGVPAVALAQWETNGPNAVLKIGGVVASQVDPSSHEVVPPSPGTLRVTVESGANAFMPLILAASQITPTGAAILNAPGLGIVNIGAPSVPLPTGIFLLGDGIGRTQNPAIDALYVTGASSAGTPSFNLDLTLPALCSQRFAFQSVVLDPAAGALPLDMTEAAAVHVRDGFRTTVIHNALDSINVSLGGDYRFDFHGTSYSSIWVNRHGFVSFGGPTTVTLGGFTIDARAFVAREPAIAVWLGDWSPQAFGPNDGILVERESNEFRIQWGEPLAMPSGAPGIAHTGEFDFNRFGLRLVLRPLPQAPCLPIALDFGRFDLTIDHVDPNTQFNSGRGLIGHTPGGPLTLAAAVDRDLHAGFLAPIGTAMIEEHDPGFRNATSVGHNGLETPRHYANFASWDMQTVSFVPTSTLGVPGYQCLPPTIDPPDDLSSATPAAWDVNGGETVTLVGKFRRFSTAGSVGVVQVIDSLGVTIPATVLGVIDSAGLSSPLFSPPQMDPALRDAEGLVIQTPAMNTMVPPLGVRVLFGSGTIRTIPFLTWSGSPAESFLAVDEGVVRYRLRGPPIQYYGQNYTEFFLSENGVVSFNFPQRNFAPSTASFFTPAALRAPNPQVAAFYTDLAPPLAGNAILSVVENPVAGTTTIFWNGFQYFATITNCGNFSMEFRPSNVIHFDHSQILGTPFFSNLPLVITGVSDQSPGVDVTNFVFGQTYNTSPLQSLARSLSIQFAANFAAFGIGGNWNAQDILGNGNWSIF